VDAAEQPPGSLALKCGSENNRLSYATQAMRYAERAGVLPRGCWKIGIVVAELVSNVRRHAYTGEVTLHVAHGPERELVVICRDIGPGIGDPDLARRDGYSRGRQLLPEDSRKTGLGAVHRLMDEVQIQSLPGRGTTVIAKLRF
jgi:anti-sigma regulatory factor (Ser/Thr protein kinase)